MSGAEQAVEDTGTVEVNMDSSEDIVVEVEDDTPEEDKGRCISNVYRDSPGEGSAVNHQ